MNAYCAYCNRLLRGLPWTLVGCCRSCDDRIRWEDR